MATNLTVSVEEMLRARILQIQLRDKRPLSNCVQILLEAAVEAYWEKEGEPEPIIEDAKAYLAAHSK